MRRPNGIGSSDEINTYGPVLVPLRAEVFASRTGEQQTGWRRAQFGIVCILDADGDGDTDIGDAISIAGVFLSR